jgi:hypothetical protein
MATSNQNLLTDYVAGLDGREVSSDLLDQIEKRLNDMKDDILNDIELRLKGSCSLREIDNYPGGYSAKVVIDLELYGMDQEPVHIESKAGKVDVEAPKIEIHEEVIVPLETDLNVVRDRSEQPVPVLTKEDGVPVVKKRKYTRRVSSEATPVDLEVGGAVDENF